MIAEEEDAYVSGSGLTQSEYDDDGKSSVGVGTLDSMLMQYFKSKGKKRKKVACDAGGSKRRKLAISEGQKVCERGEVLMTHFENVGKPPNIVCRVESFCEDVDNIRSDER
ncbi:uncharacterized protein LOC110713234 [Chenopodium quinoa]|uniref:uncharacterized protein LOC110713234 n=1 Tax=Chenopodium quinoa TaxID=63459 RepID=UPI000B77CD57|nr:uncharacterized protein LOC110713234 [Chenopodium quinoa]XP_021747385.1 uncharacterized protein LOC110713234 [Chenopodium quinoa]XP_021747386.1 uncharacterized protein LOC110713234 [Chenopodium quinoa]